VGPRSEVVMMVKTGPTAWSFDIIDDALQPVPSRTASAQGGELGGLDGGGLGTGAGAVEGGLAQGEGVGAKPEAQRFDRQ
jgi:hypothetical protein